MHKPINKNTERKVHGGLPFGVWFCSVLAAVVLMACGGEAGRTSKPAESSTTPLDDPIVVTVGPGEFRGAFPLASLTKETIQQAWTGPSGSKVGSAPAYGVACWRVEYLTVDGTGQRVLASALAVLPQKASGALSPVLAYQHGTTPRNAQAPSNQCNEAEPSVMLASLGYIVLAADYVGYGSSKGTAHPYLLAEPSAAVIADLLTAAKYWRQTQSVKDNRQLFLMGYSEGAYMSLATGRKLALGSSTHARDLKAIIAGAGPNDVNVTLDDLLSQVRAANPVLGALVNPGFLKFLSDSARASVRNALLKEMLGADADVEFQSTLIDNYLADNIGEIARTSSVHDWKPLVPLRLFHGADDRVVSYRTSTSTLTAMQARGAGNLVDLTPCNAPLADHLGCVLPFLGFSVEQFGRLASDL